MGQAQLQDQLSILEWQELEQTGEVRYEYHHGEIFAMAGGTLNHTRISGNAYRAIENNFEATESDCQAFTSELKIEIEQEGRYVYPDTLAVCGEIAESDKVKGAILNPVLVVEVTSKSSESYDRTGKFEFYTSLPSLKQYLIASQYSPFVTLYNRNGTNSSFDKNPVEIRGLTGVIDLFSVQLMLPMKALYRNVEFDKSAFQLHSIKK